MFVDQAWAGGGRNLVKEDQPSSWLVSQLGEHALEVRRCVAEALNESHWSRQTAQQATPKLTTAHTYGGAWPLVFFTVASAVRDLEIAGAHSFRPRNAPYPLSVVNGKMLVPFKHSDNLLVPLTQAKVTSKIISDIAAVLAPAPLDPTLFDQHPELRPPELREIGNLEPTTSLLYVPYVVNPRADRVLKAWFGEAVQREDGTLNWIHYEEIPSTGPDEREGGLGRYFGGPTPLGGGAGGGVPHGFTEGVLPDLNVAPRTRRTADQSDE